MISIAVNLSFLFLLLALLSLTIIILYLSFWRPSLQNPFCQVTSDCPQGSSCIHNSCLELQCENNDDCPQPSICVNSYCYSYSCLTSNDCPINSACIDGYCLAIGMTCGQNSDCGPLSCRKGICVQCTQNSDCNPGSICINNVCSYGEPSAIPPGNQILYLSNANFNGNISAPSGYYCGSDLCGQSDQPQTPYICGISGTCPETCPYCVSSVCRCVPGDLYESCYQNSDCASDLCRDTERGRICVQDDECAFNYNENGGQGTCTNPHKPYCVNGICSATSSGALCGSSSDPPDLCANPFSLTHPHELISPNTPDGMGFFCVNGHCQMQAGTLNDLCSGNSCQYINQTSFICNNHRCVNK